MFNKSNNTKQAYNLAYKQFKGYVKKEEITLITDETLQQYVNHIKLIYMPNTVMLKFYGIVYLLELIDGIKINTKLITLPQKGKNIAPKTIDQAIINKCRNKVMKTKRDDKKLILELLIQLGLRRSEVANLRWEDIKGESLLIKNSKCNKSRILPLNKQLRIMFDKIPNEGEHVFYNWSEIKITTFIKGLDPNISPHMFRHTLITSLIRNNVDIITVQSISGHSNINSLQCYYFPELNDLTKALNAINHNQTN